METSKQPKFIWCLAQLDTCIADYRVLIRRRNVVWTFGLMAVVIVSITIWSIWTAISVLIAPGVVLSLLLFFVTRREYSRWKRTRYQLVVLGQDVEAVRVTMNLLRQNENWSEMQYQLIRSKAESLPIFPELARYPQSEGVELFFDKLFLLHNPE